MQTFDSAVESALAAGALVPRDFLWIVARNRSTGAAQPWGAWSGLGTISATVLHPETGAETVRSFDGAGDLVQVDGVRLVLGLTVQTVQITLSQVAADVDQLVRTWDARFARVELFRGFLDPTSDQLVAPAIPRFVGFVDKAPVVTPQEGGTGGVRLSCASMVQELTRAESHKRSDADQRRRDPTDTFYQHAATVGSWQIFWVND